MPRDLLEKNCLGVLKCVNQCGLGRTARAKNTERGRVRILQITEACRPVPKQLPPATNHSNKNKRSRTSHMMAHLAFGLSLNSLVIDCTPTAIVSLYQPPPLHQPNAYPSTLTHQHTPHPPFIPPHTQQQPRHLDHFKNALHAYLRAFIRMEGICGWGGWRGGHLELIY